MKKFYTLVFVFFLASKTFAQFSIVQKTTSDVGVVNNTTNAILQQPDSKIVLLGSVQEGSNYKITLLRFDSTGAADPSFGHNGTDTFRVSTFLPKPYNGASLKAIALQRDGKIVAAGTAYYPSSPNYLSNMLVIRFNTNGAIDTSFGDKGTVRLNINSSTGSSIDDAYALAVQSDGKIVMAGTSYDLIQHRMIFIRLNYDGSVDTHFGLGGVTAVDINHKDDEALDITILPDGKMLAAGETYVSNHSYDAALLKLTKDGALDNSFGINGIVTTRVGDGGDIANTLAVMPNGKIIVAGTTQVLYPQPTDVLVMRYKPDGTLDSSFANNGKKIADVGGLADAANSIFIQPDNKILIGGYTQINAISNFLSMRLNTNGSFDNNFGTAGIVASAVYGQGDQAQGMILQADGKFLLGGQSSFGASKYISLLRYKTDGSSDNSFALNGKKLVGIGSSEDVAYRMIRLPWDNSLLLCGTANKFWSLIKYKANGSLQVDSSFGVNGRVASVYTYATHIGVDAAPDIAVDTVFRKIYLCGLTQGSGLTLVRFNRDGSTDTSFGNKGVVNYFANLFYGGLAVQSNHKIIIAGINQENMDYQFVTRFNYNGTVDSSFGTLGKIIKLPFTVNAIITGNTDKQIYLSGLVPLKNFEEGVGILALKPNGSVDDTFGEKGLAQNAIPNGSAEVYFRYMLARDANGRFLVSGGVQVYDNFHYQFSVTRFLKNGQPDASFGNSGVVITDETSGGFTDTYNMGIASFGKGKNCEIVTTGSKENDATLQSKAVIILYKKNGIIDPVPHTTKGYVDTSFFGDSRESAFATLVDESDPAYTSIYIAGNASNGITSDFMLVKFMKQNITIDTKENAIIAEDKMDMKVAPNPAHGFLNVQFTPQQDGNIKLELVTVSGKLIYSVPRQNMNAYTQQVKIILPAGIAPGLYFLKLTAKDGCSMQKIIIE